MGQAGNVPKNTNIQLSNQQSGKKYPSTNQQIFGAKVGVFLQNVI